MTLTQISTDGVKDDAVTAGKIPANAVGSSELADNAVDTAAIADNSITSDKLQTDSVVSGKIADGAVTTARIGDSQVTSAKIAANAITTNKLTDSNVTTAKIADDAVTQAKINVPLSNRNLIVNGAMNVAQRGTSTTAANSYGTVDRFATISSGLNEATTKSQADIASGTTPYTLGFRKSLKIQNGNQTGGASATDYVSIRYRIEAQDVAQSGWDYTSASSFITLSFWVKSSVAQNFYGRLLTNDGSVYSYPFETGSLSADTWTKVTKTIPGNSNLTVNNDNGIGLQLHITQFWGTNYTDNSVTLNQWGAHNGTQRVPDYTTTWYLTNDATFELTGVQLEVGSVATQFEHRSFSEELARCQRYYQQVGSTNTGLGGDHPMFVGYTYLNGLRIAATHTTNVKMRTTPTMAEIGNGMSIYGQGTNAEVASIFGIQSADDTNLVAFTVDGVSSKDFGGIDIAMTVTNKTGGGVSFSAEL